jgi:hypothetical protein
VQADGKITDKRRTIMIHVTFPVLGAICVKEDSFLGGFAAATMRQGRMVNDTFVMRRSSGAIHVSRDGHQVWPDSVSDRLETSAEKALAFFATNAAITAAIVAEMRSAT